MFPLIEVQCPFCKATGQIMAPPMGSIVVGPCPQCDEIVLLYDGTVMPLDKDIISEGTREEKKQHLLETIIDMVAEKVDGVIEGGDIRPKSAREPGKKKKDVKTASIKPSVRDKKAPPISREDIRDFVNIDLHLIDSKGHFDKMFKKKRTGR
jgi:hypothetical protein